MPIFELKCGRCGHVFEEIILSGSDEESQCPRCRSKKVSRLISRTGCVRKSGSSAAGASSAASCGSGGFT